MHFQSMPKLLAAGLSPLKLQLLPFGATVLMLLLLVLPDMVAMLTVMCATLMRVEKMTTLTLHCSHALLQS